MLGGGRTKVLTRRRGDPLHLAKKGGRPRRAGVPQVLLCRNGDLVRLAPGPAEVIDQIPSGRLYKDGSLLIEAEARTIAARRRLSFSGIGSVPMAMNDKGPLVAYPAFELIALP